MRPLLLLALVGCAGNGGDNGKKGKKSTDTDIADTDSDTDIAETDTDTDTDTDPSSIDRYPLDDVLTLSDVQARGTHNSSHIEPAVPVSNEHRYTHAPLGVQLEDQGVRQFELDIHYRLGEGFQVFHLPLVDAETVCLQLTDCLQEIEDWSDANPDHMPIMIWIEPKDEDMDWAIPSLLPLDGHFGDLEQAILSVLPEAKIITPDEIRGAHDTLPDAIAADGWPPLRQLRGRVMFSLLDSGSHRDDYLEGADNLAGKLMFVDSDSELDPFAAMFKINNAQSDYAEVQSKVAAGFIVTCNADSADASDADNESKRDASLASGAHYLSSDSPAPDGGAYWLEIADGDPARCNPVIDNPDCDTADIEDLLP